MLRPALSQIIEPTDSYYEFVVAIAKRAREIADQNESQHIMMEEKPVKLAVEEFAAGTTTVLPTV